MLTPALGGLPEHLAQGSLQAVGGDVSGHICVGRGERGKPRRLSPFRVTQAAGPHRPAGRTASKASPFGG